MFRRSSPIGMFIFILILVALAAWVDFSKNITILNPFDTSQFIIDRNVETRLGLDLRGGLQVLLEADLPAETKIDPDAMVLAKTILEKRTNAYGVSENVLQLAGERRIVGEFPGVEDSQAVLATLKQTGLLEFVDTGDTRFNVGDELVTDYGGAVTADGKTVFHTVMTGKDLATAAVGADTVGRIQINFTLTTEGTTIFGDHTSKNIGKILTIVLDKKVISSPSINGAITSGSGVIQGQFTSTEAKDLVVQLKYGSLPIPLKIVETRTVGPTLGKESIDKSLLAGIIGLAVVALFMAFYYRLPGVIADLALACYALLVFALFKTIPVTLTLPGIAGFILSIGMAVDANVLIFERLKEELRSGKNLRTAIDLGWSRAWSSIRDSNISTLITCVILYWFGNTFGASLVKGFALTLALGVGVSLFTAIIVTRTFLHLVLDNVKLDEHPRWFGI